MSIKSDINWIKNELDNVNDPDLISMVKDLLNNRGQEVGPSSFHEERVNYAKQSERDLKDEKIYSPEEAIAELNKRLKK